MYWAKKPNDNFGVVDGKQRIMSICRFYNNGFAYAGTDIKGRLDYFYSFRKTCPELETQFLNYELQVYICDDNQTEKLIWFETVNIASVTFRQELRNAVYIWTFISDAKDYLRAIVQQMNLLNRMIQ